MRRSPNCRHATPSRRRRDPQAPGVLTRTFVHGRPCGLGSRWPSRPASEVTQNDREDVRRHSRDTGRTGTAAPGTAPSTESERETDAVPLRVAHGKAWRPELAPAAPVTAARLPVSVAAEAVSGGGNEALDTERSRAVAHGAPRPQPARRTPVRGELPGAMIAQWMRSTPVKVEANIAMAGWTDARRHLDIPAGAGLHSHHHLLRLCCSCYVTGPHRQEPACFNCRAPECAPATLRFA